MTSGRKGRPAGAPKDWEGRAPAGTPEKRQVGEADRERDGGGGELFSDSENKSTTDADDASADSEEASAVEGDLDALLADVKRERDEYLELAKRAKADFENFRKRSARQADEAEQRGKAVLARELVPAIDNLERALQAAGVELPGEVPESDGPASQEVSAHEALARGVALVLGELQATLERAGVETYDPLGERFDPVWHEALSTRTESGKDAGIVLETLERGYRLDGQVLRPARVVVSE
jgi:molecular chaperone GrpE